MSEPTTHVIFDLGGTIVDFIPILVNILRNYAISLGKELSTEIEAYIPNADSIGNVFTEFFDSINVRNENERTELKGKLAKQLLAADMPLVSGVDRLIKHLHKHNIPMAIANNVTNREFQIFISKFGDYYTKYFSHCVCGADDPEVKNNKPFPDVYLICAKRFKTEPKSLEKCVIFEDSMTGITGAVDSGMKTVLINDRRVCSFESIANKITSIADSFDDFRPESVGLPQY